ncbi:hypothetical protein SGRIM119S_01775 [Streptomyces griseorubiginosus]
MDWKRTSALVRRQRTVEQSLALFAAQDLHLSDTEATDPDDSLILPQGFGVVGSVRFTMVR